MQGLPTAHIGPGAFDLSQPSGNVVPATLALTHCAGLGPGHHTSDPWDVATHAAVVNNPRDQRRHLCADLGSRLSYGTFSIPTYAPQDFRVPRPLNSAAIQLLRDTSGGFFTISGQRP